MVLARYDVFAAGVVGRGYDLRHYPYRSLMTQQVPLNTSTYAVNPRVCKDPCFGIVQI